MARVHGVAWGCGVADHSLADDWHSGGRAARMASGAGQQGHGETAAVSLEEEGASTGRRRWRVRLREAESVRRWSKRRWIFLGASRPWGAEERIGGSIRLLQVRSDGLRGFTVDEQDPESHV